MNTKWFACLLAALGVTGCPKIDVDTNEGGAQPTVEFDPANKVIPFPNNLLLDPATGKVNLPATCNPNGGTESPVAQALREQVLNKLDGFGTFKTTLNVTFTEAVDPASLTDHVFLYKIADAGMPVNPAMSDEIPVVAVPNMTVRFDASCANPQVIPQVTFVPAVPLDQHSTYVVALTEGITTASGAPFLESFVWGIVRSAQRPVTFDAEGNVVDNRTPLDPNKDADLETLKGIDILWSLHEKPMQFLAAKGHANATVLLGWSFNTETTIDPLDPTVAGSPASDLGTTPLLGNQSIAAAAANRVPPSPFSQCAAADNNTQCFLKVAIGAGNYAAGDAACGSLGCAAIGDVLGSVSVSKQYQLETPNPYTGTGAEPVPGPWSDPLAPTMVKDEQVEVLVVVPAQAPPASGYPIVVFQHGIGQSKTNVFAIGGQLAALGFATVAIDSVGHDSRAVRVSNDPAIGCGDVTTGLLGPRPDLGPSPVTAPQCYAPFLSSNLATTRDGIRQTVLDQQRLIEAVKACGVANCGAFQADAAHITYLGQSLVGGLMGSATTSVRDDLTASVLNVPGVGWVDILENTQTLQIRCALVDGLIDAGILTGDKFDPMAGTGLCVGEEWKTQPGYIQFAVIGRWVLDPADPVNFTSRLATKRFLIQRVDADTVVPNAATDTEGALVGLAVETADCGVPNPAPPPAFLPSTAITTNPMSSKFLNYLTVAPGTASCPPGNTFAHGSLLRPANNNNDGRLATARMQTDALTFLSINK